MNGTWALLDQIHDGEIDLAAAAAEGVAVMNTTWPSGESQGTVLRAEGENGVERLACVANPVHFQPGFPRPF